MGLVPNKHFTAAMRQELNPVMLKLEDVNMVK